RRVRAAVAAIPVQFPAARAGRHERGGAGSRDRRPGGHARAVAHRDDAGAIDGSRSGTAHGGTDGAPLGDARGRWRVMRRLASALALFLTATFAFAGVPGHVAAKEITANKVIDYETIVGSLNPDGSLHRVRLLDDLRVFGHGDVTVIDPSGTNDVRNLLGYSGPEVQGGNL